MFVVHRINILYREKTGARERPRSIISVDMTQLIKESSENIAGLS